MNHIGRASMQKSLHLCSVCLHQWRAPRFALKYRCTPPPPPETIAWRPSPPPHHGRLLRTTGGEGGNIVAPIMCHVSLCVLFVFWCVMWVPVFPYRLPLCTTACTVVAFPLPSFSVFAQVGEWLMVLLLAVIDLPCLVLQAIATAFPNGLQPADRLYSMQRRFELRLS